MTMAKGIVSTYVKCPYYRREERKQEKKIVCEGCVDNTSIHQIFVSVLELKQHKDRYCMCDYNKCPIAQMLNQKYGYDG